MKIVKLNPQTMKARDSYDKFEKCWMHIIEIIIFIIPNNIIKPKNLPKIDIQSFSSFLKKSTLLLIFLIQFLIFVGAVPFLEKQ